MNIQPDFNEYKVWTNMCQYFLKAEYQCSQDMKRAAKEGCTHQQDCMKTIVAAYLKEKCTKGNNIH